jgi:hypothetical protein
MRKPNNVGRIVFAKEWGGRLEVFDPSWAVRMFGHKLASVDYTASDRINIDGHYFHLEHGKDSPKTIEAFTPFDEDGCFYSLWVEPAFLYPDGTITGGCQLGVFEPTKFLGSFANRQKMLQRREKPKIDMQGISPLEWLRGVKSVHLTSSREYDLDKGLTKSELIGVADESLKNRMYGPSDLSTFIQTATLTGGNHVLRRGQKFRFDELFFGKAHIYAEKDGEICVSRGYAVDNGVTYVTGISREQFNPLAEEVQNKLSAFYDEMKFLHDTREK